MFLFGLFCVNILFNLGSPLVNYEERGFGMRLRSIIRNSNPRKNVDHASPLGSVYMLSFIDSLFLFY